MREATLLEARLSKVEQDNRRLKLALGALLLALAAVPLIGAVMPEQISGTRYLPDVIQAHGGFRVVNWSGKVRATMDFETGIRYYDPLNATLRASMSDRGISYSDESGNIRAEINKTGIAYRDENFNVVWSTGCAPNC